MSGDLLNSSVVVALVTTMGTIVAGLGVVLLRRKAAKPSDPMQTILKHQDAFISRLLAQVEHLSKQLDAVESELFKTKETLLEVRRNLAEATQSNRELQHQLAIFKMDHGISI